MIIFAAMLSPGIQPIKCIDDVSVTAFQNMYGVAGGFATRATAREISSHDMGLSLAGYWERYRGRCAILPSRKLS